MDALNLTHTLHLIEPTLFDQTGHGYSYTKTLIQANQNFKLHVWLDQRGKNLLQALPCTPHLFFMRRYRQFQKLWLYIKLLKQQSVFYICTAERLDLILLHSLHYFFQIQPHQVFLHFHQLNAKPKKLKQLKKIAGRNPNFTILCPTTGLVSIFKKIGFSNTHLLPCPSFPPKQNQHAIKKPVFEKVLYAGAARADKGFPKVVQLVESIISEKKQIPLAIQISKPNSNRYDAASQAALDNLHQKKLENDITLYPDTLSQPAYQALFENAICLLLYDPKSYQHKFSGVALDAFYAGAPVITTDGTWIADMVLRFQAGLVLEHDTTKAILASIKTIQAQYTDFSQQALIAGKTLQQEHKPENTLNFLARRVIGCKTNG